MPSSDPSSSTAAAVQALDVGELAEWVGIASVSRDATPETMRAAAEWLAARLGPMAGRVEDTAGHPVVRGEWLGAPGAPTVLV
ncbi:MAG: peptidase M20, partial [Actinomycetota bacterium]